jgi:Uma2 family endonuclease
MAAPPKLMTADELLRLPDDGQRHELVRGELRTMSPGGDEHGWIALEIGSSLRGHVRTHRLGRAYGAETGFKLSENPDTVRAPDVAFVRHERILAAPRITGFRAGAPDLVVEIISPNDLYSEVAEKVAMWLAHGCRMVIVVHPRGREVVIHRSPNNIRHLTIDDTIDGEEVVPGWRLPVRELFPDDDEGGPTA